MAEKICISLCILLYTTHSTSILQNNGIQLILTANKLPFPVIRLWVSIRSPPAAKTLYNVDKTAIVLDTTLGATSLLLPLLLFVHLWKHECKMTILLTAKITMYMVHTRKYKHMPVHAHMSGCKIHSTCTATSFSPKMCKHVTWSISHIWKHVTCTCKC